LTIQTHGKLIAGLVLVLAACAPLASTPVATGATQAPGQTAPPIAESTGIPTATATASLTPENIPNLSGETIVLPAFCDQSSPLAGGNASRVRALEDVAAAINAQGGIFGAQLDLRIIDSMGNPEEAQRALARIVRQFGEGPLVLICDPQTETALGEMLTEDEIPALGPADFAERDGYLFGLDATPQEHLGFFLEQLTRNWAELQPAGAGPEIRLALVSWTADVSGLLTSEEFLADLGETEIQVVYQAELPAEPDANIYDLIYQIRDANANVIYTNLRGFGLAALLNGLQELGLTDRFVVGAPAAGYDSQVFEYLSDPANAIGLYLTSGWAWWSEQQNPGIGFLADLDGAQSNDWGYIQMAGAVALAQYSLQEAILDVGFASLSPEAVFDALMSVEDYPVLSGLFTVDYSGGNRSLQDLRIWVVGEDASQLEIRIIT
jgi:ABC-type branched-subunit amino acid transport system substrate-binding protein